MCITAPARVVAIDPDGATVELGGRYRRASTVVLPDIRVGEWVIVGAGTVLRRVDPVEALELNAAIRTAMSAADGLQAPAPPELPGGIR